MDALQPQQHCLHAAWGEAALPPAWLLSTRDGTRIAWLQAAALSAEK